MALLDAKLEQLVSQPDGKIEKIRLFELLVEPTNAIRENGEELFDDDRVCARKGVKIPPVKHQGLRRLEGDDCRGPRTAVEEGKVAEEVARAKDGDDCLFSVGGREHDLDLTADDDQEGIAG